MNTMSDEFTMPPRMYHGTTTQYLSQILEFGLLPRLDSDVDTSARYTHGEIKSASGMVYLSATSAIAYASYWCKPPHMPLVVEVDTARLDIDNFYPDEDDVIISIINKRRGTEGQVHSATQEEWLEIQTEAKETILSYQELRSFSMNRFKRVAHKGAISKECISRYATVNLTDKELAVLKSFVEMAESSSKIERYKLSLSDKEIHMLSRLNEWMFGADLTASYFETQAVKFQRESKDKLKGLLRKRPQVVRLESGIPIAR